MGFGDRPGLLTSGRCFISLSRWKSRQVAGWHGERSACTDTSRPGRRTGSWPPQLLRQSGSALRSLSEALCFCERSCLPDPARLGHGNICHPDFSPVAYVTELDARGPHGHGVTLGSALPAWGGLPSISAGGAPRPSCWSHLTSVYLTCLQLFKKTLTALG